MATTDPCYLKTHSWTFYEVTWTPRVDDFTGWSGDFWLIQDIERWLVKLVHVNITDDDLSTIKKEWSIFHVPPGRIGIFLELRSCDQPRLNYPLQLPAWRIHSLSNSSFQETTFDNSRDFNARLFTFMLEPHFSSHHRIITHHHKQGKAENTN